MDTLQNSAKVDKGTKIVLGIFLVLVLMSLATIYYEYIVIKNFEVIEVVEEASAEIDAPATELE